MSCAVFTAENLITGEMKFSPSMLYISVAAADRKKSHIENPAFEADGNFELLFRVTLLRPRPHNVMLGRGMLCEQWCA